MKRNIVGFFSMLATTLLLASPALSAQNRIDAYVPFDFSVGQTVMAEGNYQVQSISETVEVVQNEASHASASLIKAIHVQSAGDHGAMLVFHRYGDNYFLAEIWTGDTSTGVALARSPREKELAQNGPMPTLAVIRLALH